MHNINRILKDNYINHKYDLIMIDYIKFIHVFIIKDVDTIEKASPLVGYSDLCKEYMYYYLKNNGFSLNRICKVDINNI